MKAVRFHEYGDPEVLRVDDVDVPTPGPGQVLVRVAATSFNGVDGNIRAGRMQGPMPLELPHIPGPGRGRDRRRARRRGRRAAGGRPGDRVPAVRRRRRRRRVRRSPPPPSLAPAPTQHPAGRRGRAPAGRAHRLAGALRARRPASRAADPRQRRQRRRGRLRRPAGQGRRRPRHRHGERPTPRTGSRPAEPTRSSTTPPATWRPAVTRAGRRAAQPGPDRARSSSPRWPPGSATAGSSSTPRSGCPPRPTRRAACAASTCTSAATPTSWPS